METGGTVKIRRIRADEGMVLRELRLRSLANAPEAFGQPLGRNRPTRGSRVRADQLLATGGRGCWR
jgi:hypothetical protein